MASENGDDRTEFLFHNLIAMFATLALQQLGKLVNPLTGAVERDLRQARITIDMLEMIGEKTAGNLSAEERRHIDTVLTELRMNWVDEANRGGIEPETTGTNEDSAAGGTDDGTKRDTTEG
ncbi:MAG: DUF1844 domain-containing protein [Candidatus Latescibacterota bacterium]|jgi:hypothetical protein|nr:MAG: DUF1844 domain-containing protein [Candidatus Latescibacterota bacterium]